MSSNIDAFIKETNAEIKKLQDKQVSEAKKIVLGAYSQTVSGSAVDTGLYRSSHLISINSKDKTIPTKKDDSRISDGKSEVNNAKFKNGDTITIQNNLLYALPLEDGHSTQQAPLLYSRVEEMTRTVINKKTKI